MCEFCLKHGEGRKWYLEAKNYSDDLLSDARRRKLIKTFLTDPETLRGYLRGVELLEKMPRFLKALLGGLVSRRMKGIHYGQVLPIEDVERILGLTNCVVRVACLCRRVTIGKEKRYCYGISILPDGGRLGQILRSLDSSYLTGPGPAGLEQLSKDAALAALKAHEREGLCHTIWTFRAPFIGGFCNCDRSDCLALRCTLSHRVPALFRAEYVATVDLARCNGCLQCRTLCQFGAISCSASDRKVVIEPSRCYGCGVCRAACCQDAIRLLDRRLVPAAASLW